MRQRSEIKRKAKELSALLPRAPTPFVPGVSFCPAKYSPIVKGNRLAAKENLSPESHQRRMAALMKCWSNQVRRNRGKKIMTHEAKKKASVTRRKKKHDKAIMDYRQMQERVRQLAPDGIKVLENILNNPASRDADKIAATQVILDRSYGKANQPNTNINLDAHGKPTEVSSKELKERIDFTIKRIEQLTRGTAEERPRPERPADIRERDGNTGGSTFH